MKKLLIICLALFLTGCSAQYNLQINEDNIVENVTVSLPKQLVKRDLLDPYLSIDNLVYPGTDLEEYYKSSLNEDSDNYYLSYNYTHDYEKFAQSLFLKKCYEKVYFTDAEDKLSLSTSNTFMCINMLDDGFYLDDANVTIKTDMKVISNNADKVSGNSYTWNIDETNYDNKPINLVIQKDMNVQNIIVENDSSFTLIFVVITVLVLLLVIFIFIRLKAKKNNAI